MILSIEIHIHTGRSKRITDNTQTIKIYIHTLLTHSLSQSLDSHSQLALSPQHTALKSVFFFIDQGREVVGFQCET